MTETTPRDRPFRLLHVCTGNICRSPMAEHLTRLALAERSVSGVEVTSAGTWGLAGSPMDPHALAALAEHGVDGSAFRAQELVAEHVLAADLIVGATREHRAAAVMLHPRAAARTFTLREFARLVERLDPAYLPAGDVFERGRALVALAAAERGQAAPGHADQDDVSDPYRAPLSQFLRCAGLIERTVRGPLNLLAGRAGPSLESLSMTPPNA